VVQEQGEHEQADHIVAEALSLASTLRNKLAVAEGLEVAARSALVRHHYRLAGRLLGAARAVRDDIGASVPPYRRPDHDRMYELVGRRLGEAPAADASDEGLRVGREALGLDDLARLVAEVLRDVKARGVGPNERAGDHNSVSSE
jgi:hypothetical protein